MAPSKVIMNSNLSCDQMNSDSIHTSPGTRHLWKWCSIIIMGAV